jgi:hypothetical protein
MADADPPDVDPGRAVEVARKAKVAIDLILMAYVKAESMSASPDEKYGDLRSDWGRFIASYMGEAFKASE